MGLYLCVFDGDDEVDGLEVGSYADYNAFRDYVVRELESGKPGSCYPALILHSDSDGEWSVRDCEKLRGELAEIATALKARAAVQFGSDWQVAVAKSIGLVPQNAFESFVDVDGEFLIERMRSLAEVALNRGLPILFQ